MESNQNIQFKMTAPTSIETKDEISIITLDDGKANAFSFEMITSLNESLEQVPKDKGALIIKGRDDLFSGGFDLKTLASGDMDAIAKMVSAGYQMLHDLYTFPRPIIALATGHAVAMGVFVLCCADYRIGIKGDFICQANEVRNNMDIPTQIMAIIQDRISKKHFYSAVYHADAFDFETSKEVGYLDEIAEPNNLMARAFEKASDLATLGHPFYEKTKQCAQKETARKVLDAIKDFNSKT